MRGRIRFGRRTRRERHGVTVRAETARRRRVRLWRKQLTQKKRSVLAKRILRQALLD